MFLEGGILQFLRWALQKVLVCSLYIEPRRQNRGDTFLQMGGYFNGENIFFLKNHNISCAVYI